MTSTNRWVAVLAVGCLSASSAASGPPERLVFSKPKDFPIKSVKLLKVSSDSGSILIRGGRQGDARVTVVGSLDNCTITTEVRGTDLVVEAKHLFMKVCSAGFAVEVDPSLPVRAYAGSGDIEISSRKAPVEADAGSGDILVRDAIGDLILTCGSGSIKAEAATMNAKAQTGSGSIELRRLLGAATVMTGSGDILLEWARPPKSGSAEVKSGSGNIDLVFPPGTKVLSRLRTGTGSSSNQLGDTPGSGWLVSAMSGTGDVSIRGPGK
ncbi:MAG: DUF4097 family beta strand repeat protein [Elusimicrobia bacterium]|nr:DUF4097 family beta strand repeat protein [Elusimicrobiota bacterium]